MWGHPTQLSSHYCFTIEHDLDSGDWDLVMGHLFTTLRKLHLAAELGFS